MIIFLSHQQKSPACWCAGATRAQKCLYRLHYIDTTSAKWCFTRSRKKIWNLYVLHIWGCHVFVFPSLLFTLMSIRFGIIVLQAANELQLNVYVFCKIKPAIMVFLSDGESGSRDIYQDLQRGPQRAGRLWTRTPNRSCHESPGPGPQELL